MDARCRRTGRTIRSPQLYSFYVTSHSSVDAGAFIPVETYLASILAEVSPVSTETIPVRAALGRTLRANALAASGIPVFDNSAMDGFAVLYDDVRRATPDAPAALSVIADLPAGSADDPSLSPGTAVRIMTGAPVPSDADTIVPFEHTVGGLDESLGKILISTRPRLLGAHIRRAGEDVVAGDEIVSAGIALSPLHLSAIAASGVAEVTVSRAPLIAVVSTGSELVTPGRPLRHGQIPESNGTLLSALAAETGCALAHSAVIPDDTRHLRRLLDELDDRAPEERIDVVVFSGGISAGAYEVVREGLGALLTFPRVEMQPGRPQAFGRVNGDCLAFGLPGNPVSVAISFEVFVRPALLALQGRTSIHRPVIALPASRGWSSTLGRRHYLPVTIDTSDPRGWCVAPASAEGSHRAGSLALADAFAIIPPEVGEVGAGDRVDVMLLS